MKMKDVIIYGGLAAIGYFLYKKYGTAIGSAVSTATQPIANAYVALTSPNAPVPQGSVSMPDGSNFPASNLTALGFGFVNGVAQFSLNGRNYALSPQVNGVYQATAL